MHFLRRAMRFVFPSVIALGAIVASQSTIAADTPAVGGDGGQPFRFECPAGQVLVGIHGRAGLWADQVAGICATWEPRQRVMGVPMRSGRLFGGRGGNTKSLMCPDTFAVAGWEIRQTRNERPTVMYVKPQCRSLADKGKLFDDRGWIFGSVIPIPRFNAVFGTVAVNHQCPGNEFALGLHGASGVYVDRLGLICGLPPIATPRPLGKQPVKVPRPLGKLPLIATANNDVDIYNGPDGSFQIVGIMRAGEQARSIQARNGWRQLAIQRVPGGTGWVADDHLTVTPAR